MRISPVSRPIKEYSYGFLARLAILIVILLLYMAAPEANLWFVFICLSLIMAGYAYWLHRQQNWFMMTMMALAAVLNILIAIYTAVDTGAFWTKAAVFAILFIDMITTPNRRQETGPLVHERYRV